MFSMKGNGMAFITQNPIDGQYETRIDGVTIRSESYDAVERVAYEIGLHRAWKTRVEESLDQSAAEHGRTPGWGGAEIAVACGFFMALCIVVATGLKIAAWLWNG